MSLLRIDASLLPATSASRALGDLVEAEWTAAHPDSVVTHRNLIESPIPADAWQNAVYAGFTPEEDRTEEQRAAVALAAQLADELIEADALLFTVPLYNFGVSQHFKLWFDLAYTDPRTNNPLLATVLGGNYGEGTPKDGWDHSTPYLTRLLQDVWGLDLRVVQRPFTLVGVNPALDQFADLAAELKADAETKATESGRELAELRGKANAA